MKKLIRQLIFIFPFLKILHNKTAKNKLRIAKNNRLDINNGLLRNNHIEIKGKNNYFRVGTESKVYECQIDINGENNIIYIGDSVSIVKADIKLWGNDNKLDIGDFTTFNIDCRIKAFEGTTIMIGKHCMISYNVDMRSSDGHPIFDDHETRINSAKGIIIGDHVWIGSYVNILKGATILENSVVGTGSLVTKSLMQCNSIIYGRPAAIRKGNINWKREL